MTSEEAAPLQETTTAVVHDTQLWHVEDSAGLARAAQLLHDGQAVAFPTETVYGLGANALSDEAVQRIFAAKGRPSDNPLIVHIAEMAQLEQLAARVTETARKLTDAFWPGPLTVVVESNGRVSKLCTAGLSSVGLRMPAHEVALQLIRQSGVPVAAPSANVSGRPSPTKAEHVLEDLRGRIVGVVDGGPTGVGVESTVVDCTSEEDEVVILRPGGITQEQLARVVGTVRVDPGIESHHSKPKADAPTEPEFQPKAPGMKYTHYAPVAPVTVLDGSAAFIASAIDTQLGSVHRVGLLASEELHHELQEAGVLDGDNKARLTVVKCGQRGDLTSVARNLYDALRQFDALGEDERVDVILAEAFARTNIGDAVMNRLMKAAANRLQREADS